ncbi:hypothetical protein ACLKA7_013626 [Drosophila subpalustris]
MDQRLMRRRRAKRKTHKTGLNKLLQEFRPNFKLPASYRRFAYDQLRSYLSAQPFQGCPICSPTTGTAQLRSLMSVCP